MSSICEEDSSSDDDSQFDQDETNLNRELKWEHNYLTLLEYFKVYGDCNVPRRYKGPLSKSGRLGTWLNKQRYLFHQGKLLPDRRDLLQALADKGALNWNPKNCKEESEITWPKMFRIFVHDVFKRANGHSEKSPGAILESHVSVFSNGAEYRLGRWVHTQKKRAREGKMRPERVRLLETLSLLGNFHWPKVRTSCVRTRVPTGMEDCQRYISKADFDNFSTFLGMDLKYEKHMKPAELLESWSPLEEILEKDIVVPPKNESTSDDLYI